MILIQYSLSNVKYHVTCIKCNTMTWWHGMYGDVHHDVDIHGNDACKFTKSRCQRWPKWATQLAMSGPKSGSPPFPAKGAHNPYFSRQNTHFAGLPRTRCCHVYCEATSVFARLGRPATSRKARASPTFSCRSLFAIFCFWPEIWIIGYRSSVFLILSSFRISFHSWRFLSNRSMFLFGMFLKWT